jgi:RNA polymerase sigma factor (sigma-70 family)
MPKGRAAKVLPRNKWYTDEEVETFFRRYPNGFSCVLWARYPGLMRLAKSVGMDPDEVESECNLGIAVARQKFDRSKSEQFSTYAVIWMRAKVSHAARSRLRQRRTTADGRLPVSGDQDIGDGATLFDMVAAEKRSPGGPDADLALIIQGLLPTLPSLYREIVEMRNGLNGKKQMTLNEIGELRGVTHERIRQMEIAAYDRIRLPLQLALSKGGYL